MSSVAARARREHQLDYTMMMSDYVRWAKAGKIQQRAPWEAASVK